MRKSSILERARNQLAAQSAQQAHPVQTSATPSAPSTPTTPSTGGSDLLAQLKAKAAAAQAAKEAALEANRTKLADARNKESEIKARVQAKLAELRAKQAASIGPTEPTVTLRLPNEAATKVTFTRIPSAPSAPVEGQGKLNQGAPLLDGTTSTPSSSTRAVSYANLNDQQKEAVRLATIRQPFVLIGSAGSGKTTTTEVAVTHLAETGFITNISAETETKRLMAGTPAIAITSFTNQAVTNIKEIVPTEYKRNCLTIHKLLEYEPVYFDIEDKTTGESRTTMRYMPARTSMNPIPKLDVCIIEEAGSVSVELFHKLESACPKNIVFIFLGDLNQIPPVFGDAILGYKILELPVVELTQIYRQSGDSPIKKLAYKILDGIPISDAALEQLKVPGTLDLFPFLVQKSWEEMVPDAGAHFRKLVRNYFTGEGATDLDRFDYTKDVLLVPYNKQLGTIELNRHIAQEITEQLGSPTYEIIAGFNKLYYAIGDIVYWNRAKWRILDIEKNPYYSGPLPRVASTDLDRWGVHKDEIRAQEELQAAMIESLEESLNLVAGIAGPGSREVEKSLHQASHRVLLQSLDDEFPDTWISQTGDITDMYLAYCLTVHKSQGSEWEKVYCLFHSSHATLIQREILYTAVTRARSKLRIYYDGEKAAKKGNSIFQRGIINQKIPGDTLEEKLKYFRDKLHAVAIKNAIEKAKSEGSVFNLAAVRAIPDTELSRTMLKELYKKIDEEQGE